MNKIVINFTACTPAPAGGYNIQYRVAGSSDAYTNAGNFFISPAVFYDTINPADTCYEGFVQTVCGNNVFGNNILWESCGSGVPAELSINWNYTNSIGTGGRFKILINGVLTVNITTTQSGTLSVSIGDFIEVLVQSIVIGTAETQITGPYTNSTSAAHITGDDFTTVAGAYTINGQSF